MDIANFHGLAPLLMNEADGGEGGGGGALAVADATGTSLTTTEGATDTSDALAETTDLATADEADSSAVAVKAANPALALLKASVDPEVKKFANNAIRAMAARKELGEMFPGKSPIAAVKALQSDMVSLAGRYYNQPDPRDPERRTGIQQIRDKMAEFEEIDLLFYSGDPRMLDGMTADEQGKSAFAKLAPAMMAKFREIAPNAYAAAFARLFLGSMKYDMLTDSQGNAVEEADIPLRLRRLAAAIPEDNLLARAEVNALSNFVWRLQEMAKLAPEVFVKDPAVSAKNDEREQRLNQREQDQRRREWEADQAVLASQIIMPVWNQITKGLNLSATAKEKINSLYSRRYDLAVRAKEPNAGENRKSYIESNDRDGYLAYEKYLQETFGIPALKTEMKEWREETAPKKLRTGADPAPPLPGGPRVASPPAGFAKVPSRPPTNVIDYSKGTIEMARNKQAVLRVPWGGKAAGTKITW